MSYRPPLIFIHATTPARHGLSPGWLVASLGVVVVATLVFLAPDVPRRMLGMPSAPVDRGSEIEVSAQLAAPEPVPVKPPVDAPKPPVVVAPVTPPAPVFPDESKATDLLSQAAISYKALKWDAASTAAAQVAGLQVSAPIKKQAEALVSRTAAMKKMFEKLYDRDELSRNYDTNPCLVEITTKVDVSIAVPTIAPDQLVAVSSDPIGAIEKQKSGGKVTFFIKVRKESFMVTTLNASAIEQVKKVDVDAIKKQALAEFEAMLSRISSSEDANQAISWYELGRFAYRNRLDGRVSSMLDRGLELDPDLVTTVREDRARLLMASMMMHLNNGNQVQAQTFLNSLNKRLGDTATAKQAQAYFRGETALVLELVQKEQAAEAAKIAARNKELDRPIETTVTPKVEEPTVVVLTGDSAIADKLLSEGRVLCEKGMRENGLDRNKVFDNAEIPLRKSRGIFVGLLKKTPEDQKIQMKLLEVNQLIYLIKKGKVFR